MTRKELLAEGFAKRQISRWLRTGALIREYRGVYRVGHRAPSTEATYLAAVRASGKGSVLADDAAAYLLGLLKGAQPEPVVITPTERRIPGLTTRRARHIDPREISELKGIPVTTVPRTLVDLAALLPLDDLARACHEARVKYKTTPKDVKRVLARRRTVNGAAKLRATLDGDAPVLLSTLERRFRELLIEDDLPLPLANAKAGGHYVDCRWPDHALTVELDSYRFHSSRHAWEQDRHRERAARARGDDFRRYTYGDVLEDTAFMLRELRELLAPARAR